MRRKGQLSLLLLLNAGAQFINGGQVQGLCKNLIKPFSQQMVHSAGHAGKTLGCLAGPH